jgi:hypothetical protein
MESGDLINVLSPRVSRGPRRVPRLRLSRRRLIDNGGPGRFRGYRGLRPVLAIRQVTPAVGIAD